MIIDCDEDMELVASIQSERLKKLYVIITLTYSFFSFKFILQFVNSCNKFVSGWALKEFQKKSERKS